MAAADPAAKALRKAAEYSGYSDAGTDQGLGGGCGGQKEKYQ